MPVECQGRPNPPTPTWLSHAKHRIQVGLANDFIGYLIPPWAFIGEAGAITATNDPDCNTGQGSTDSAGHHHKLETEGVGPTASDLVARNATLLQVADGVGRPRLGAGRVPLDAEQELAADQDGAEGRLDAGVEVRLPPRRPVERQDALKVRVADRPPVGPAHQRREDPIRARLLVVG